MANFKDSVYRFTDPIRYFKENDPYYWEVDNIPLKQIQENILWIKDQITPIETEEVITDTGINRSDINELKPFCTESDNLLYIKNGRYVARINDAYSLSPLQKLSALTNTSAIEQTLFQTAYANTPNDSNDFATRLIQGIQAITTSSFNLNGLLERVNFWNNNIISASSLTYNSGHPDIEITNVPWPVEELGQYVRTLSINASRDSLQLGLEFVKQFRGVARTAVVDVVNADPIEIPAFDENDFYYKQADGTTVLIPGATHRIDLLFVYSKPVDSTITTINSWSGNSPRQITKPILGLIKGAGVGLRTISSETGTGNNTFLGAKSSEGHTQILADINDENQDTNGFEDLNIHGSFPSPDDLMNLAPIIQEKFESSDPRLIGQSILPIAYIVVKKNADISQGGVPIITTNDIIDIRPFLRTTELAYNERAGIAAAVPSPSLANPVATKYNIEESNRDLKNYVDLTFQKKSDVTPGGFILAGGIIRGGKLFGPEKRIHEWRSPATPYTEDVPDYPMWDLAFWAQNQNNKFTVERSYPTNRYDYVQTKTSLQNGDLDDGRSISMNSQETKGTYQDQFYYLLLKKKITITNVPSYVVNYNVKLNYHDCVPIVDLCKGSGETYDWQHGTFGGLFVEKLPTTTAGIISFIVRVAVPFSVNRTPYRYTKSRLPWNYNLDPNVFNYFSLTTGAADTLADATYNNFNGALEGNYVAVKNGASMYPSVSFDIIGYTESDKYLDGVLSDNINGGTVISL